MQKRTPPHATSDLPTTHLQADLLAINKLETEGLPVSEVLLRGHGVMIPRSGAQLLKIAYFATNTQLKAVRQHPPLCDGNCFAHGATYITVALVVLILKPVACHSHPPSCFCGAS